MHLTGLASRGIPPHIEAFCKDAIESGAKLVLPRTVLLELQRFQSEYAEQRRNELRKASKLMTDYGVAVPIHDVENLVKNVDLIELFGLMGINLEVVDPLLEDYQDAERRASLHLSPQSASAKADEMRDLVIWNVAIRIAERDGKALLVSRDEVHSHDRGADEAAAVGLLRASTFDDALVHLGRASPVGTLAIRLLAPVWETLRQAGLPLPEQLAISRVAEGTFVSEPIGRLSGSFRFSAVGSSGPISAKASIRPYELEGHIEVTLRNIVIAGKPRDPDSLQVVARGDLPSTPPIDERIAALRELVGKKT